MQQLMQTRFFRILSEHSQDKNILPELEDAYDDFALKILIRLQTETVYTELFYSLGFIHLKLAGICEKLSGEVGKKRLESCDKSHVFGRVG